MEGSQPSGALTVPVGATDAVPTGVVLGPRSGLIVLPAMGAGDLTAFMGVSARAEMTLRFGRESEGVFGRHVAGHVAGLGGARCQR